MRRSRALACFLLIMLCAAGCGGGRSGTGVSDNDVGSVTSIEIPPAPDTSSSPQPQAPSQSAPTGGQSIRFSGTVVGAECAANALFVANPDGNVSTVDLSTSSLRDRSGNAVDCAAVQDGDAVQVESSHPTP